MARNSNNAEDVLMLILIIIAAAISRASSPGTRFCDTNSDNLQLKELSSLPVDPSSTTNQDLHNSSYWAAVGSSWWDTLGGLLSSTYLGFFNSSQEWRIWSLQHFPNASSWVGFSIERSVRGQMARLESDSTRTDNATDARATVKNYFASISGYSFATLDFASYNGLTSLKTAFETGSASQALCATFPGQLAQLYHLAFDSTVPQNRRAQYLGKALAITSVMVVLSGHDQFADKLKIALDRVGLLDAWPAIKPYLANLGTTISARAASLTFSVLQKIAQRFPQNSPWYAGLTIDRIEAMTEVLKEKGFTNDQIEQRITGLVQAADGAKGPDEIADDADVVSYNDGGGIRMKLTTQNRMYLYTDSQTMATVKASFLEKMVPGFKALQSTMLKVYYWESKATAYHEYTGGDNWVATVPDSFAKRGDVLTVTISVLTKDDFVNSLPKVTWGNEMGAKWMTDLASLNTFKLSRDRLRIGVTEEPDVEGVSSFVIDGSAAKSLGFIRGDAYLQFGLTDIFGRTRLMRVYYDGYGSTSLGIQTGKPFLQVVFLSSDGVRLKVAYSEGPSNLKVATIYTGDPSVLYALGNADYNLPVYLEGTPNAFQIDGVIMNRQLEKTMLTSGSLYDLGRLGAEIAYTIANEKLGLRDVVIGEPSQGGADLITKDEQVVMQARFLRSTQYADPDTLKDIFQIQLADMAEQLKLSFKLNPSAHTGYVMLSYLDNQGNIRTIVVEAPRP